MRLDGHVSAGEWAGRMTHSDSSRFPVRRCPVWSDRVESSCSFLRSNCCSSPSLPSLEWRCSSFAAARTPPWSFSKCWERTDDDCSEILKVYSRESSSNAEESSEISLPIGARIARWLANGCRVFLSHFRLLHSSTLIAAVEDRLPTMSVVKHGDILQNHMHEFDLPSVDQTTDANT